MGLLCRRSRHGPPVGTRVRATATLSCSDSVQRSADGPRIALLQTGNELLGERQRCAAVVVAARLVELRARRAMTRRAVQSEEVDGLRRAAAEDARARLRHRQ